MTINNKLFAISILCFLEFFSLFLSTHGHKNVQCGKPNAKVNEFPWMAHILVRNPSGRLLTCGGTLISAQHIITAAHCLIEDGSDRVFRILNITLGARDVSPDSNDRIHHQVFNWKVLTIPEIHNNIIEHNIAIIALSKPAIFNDYVQPACLPFGNDSDQVSNTSVVFTGWGQSTGALQCCSREAGPVRRQWNTTVISSFGKDVQCPQSSTLSKYFGDNHLICTEASKQRRFCNGDDGGSLNWYNAKRDRWFVIGIAGRANSDNCRMKSSSINANKRPNILTRVRNHLDFIREHSGVILPVIKERVPQTIRGKNRMKSTTTEIPTPSTSIKSTSSLLMTTSFSCKGKPPGNYPNPTVNCSTDFFMCSDFNSYLLTCSHGLIYRADANVCDWPSNVPGCSSKSFTTPQ